VRNAWHGGGGRPLILGNWKMNGLRATLAQAVAIDAMAARRPGVAVGLAPPFTLLAAMAGQVRHMAVGGQDCHEADRGAFTGAISPVMLADAGARFVILGHSERRALFGDSDARVRAKVAAAWGAGLGVVLCVGETEGQRAAGRAQDTVVGQLAASLPNGDMPDGFPPDGAGLVVAYEPVWAIGSGRVPGIDSVRAMHRALRAHLCQAWGAAGGAVPLLYGGSVGADNAAALLNAPEVDGALVGGASLSADSFGPILEAAAARAPR
jgi:triosephosphate isomerase (TIM)